MAKNDGNVSLSIGPSCRVDWISMTFRRNIYQPQWITPNDLTDPRAAMVSERNNNTSINNHQLF